MLEQSATPCRVLLVDDDAGIRALLDMAVSLDTRFELVAAAGTAAEALAQALAISYDVALVDVTLPDGDGIDLIQQLRRTPGDASHVLFTGWSDDESTLARASAVGVDAVFRKDLSPTQLLDELHRLHLDADELSNAPTAG